MVTTRPSQLSKALGGALRLGDGTGHRSGPVVGQRIDELSVLGNQAQTRHWQIMSFLQNPKSQWGT